MTPNMLLRGLAALVFAFCLVPVSTFAQQTNAVVVATCGTPPATYPAGANRQLTQDTTGKLCSDANFSGSVTATTSATASANPTPVIAGTGKPINEGLFSNLFTTPVYIGGTVTMNAIGGTVTTDSTAHASKVLGVDAAGAAISPALAANQTSVIGTKAAGTAATNSLLGGVLYTTALPTLTNGQQAAVQADSSGRIIVNCGTGCTGGLAQGSTTSGQTGGLVMGAATTASPTTTTANTYPLSMDVHGALRILNMASDGTVLDPASPINCGPTSTFVQCPTFAVQALQATAAKQATLDGAGAQIVPKAGTADRVVTKTSVSANTSTTICPTATSPVTTEIWVESGSMGISLAGGTLTQATWGTTASTKPDLVLTTAGLLYTLPVAATNAITGYSGTAQGVTCIQTLRQ